MEFHFILRPYVSVYYQYPVERGGTRQLVSDKQRRQGTVIGEWEVFLKIWKEHKIRRVVRAGFANAGTFSGWLQVGPTGTHFGRGGTFSNADRRLLKKTLANQNDLLKKLGLGGGKEISPCFTRYVSNSKKTYATLPAELRSVSENMAEFPLPPYQGLHCDLDPFLKAGGWPDQVTSSGTVKHVLLKSSLGISTENGHFAELSLPLYTQHLDNFLDHQLEWGDLGRTD
ncbi:hypothetical protein NDU88_006629 [Pleurodeles waltl]|uniref:Uncharacterized protein n=1 Tax=Pleurodeles waltl TaxID=8319 RepID=A0AAV7WFD4_PLEWA|nr:hypothetical protein NDU88_006629 [Pleurodeles waltl]